MAEVTWVVRSLDELGISNLKLVALHINNQSALHTARNPIFHKSTKHIELIVTSLVTLQLTYLLTRSQLADILSKVAILSQFKFLLSKLGMVSSPNLRKAIEFPA